MSKRCVGLVILLSGISGMAAGIGLGGYNLWDNYQAGVQADNVLDAIVQPQEETAATDPNETLGASPELPPNCDRELTTLEVDGHRYIGTVSIPVIDVALPVQEDWSLALLKVTPCRYMGSPYQRNLIICAHNYATHFGRLKDLLPGDEVLFTDVEGNEFLYTVVELQTLAGTAVEEMESGAWDLTLFTCTLGGQTRITVRCDLLENKET